jgi:DNA invertase Pin-like site-specific DNA recombinase
MTPGYDEPQAADLTKLRYVLYARKSTEDESKQLRSIEDQQHDCEILANNLGIKIVARLEERKSAKSPDNRAVFSQMLKDIRAGKYDGIIAWHPDRLARNMREGGELIDMIDEGVLKDLRFVTHYFTNDANGKMLLGMAFVLSKHYSDDLSQKVTRGVRLSFAEGKSSGAPKPGYIRDENGFYQPDGKNFELISQAWQMRLTNTPYRDIADYLNNNGYGRKIKSLRAKRAGQIIKMDWRRLSEIFSDPFYYGVLVQANNEIDLRNIPNYTFVPAVEEADWNAVQSLTTRNRRNLHLKKRATYYPLRGMVICSYCDRLMYAGASKGHNKRYLYYTCQNQECERKPKAIRAKVVFNFVYDFLRDGLNLTEDDYATYQTKLQGIAENKRQRFTMQLRSRQGALKDVERQIKDRSLAIVNYDKGSAIWKANDAEIQRLTVQRETLEDDITKLKRDLAASEVNNFSIEQFLNLSKLAGTKLEAASVEAKDRICQMIFLNFTVDTEKVVDLQIREPFATLLKTKNVLNGRGDRT